MRCRSLVLDELSDALGHSVGVALRLVNLIIVRGVKGFQLILARRLGTTHQKKRRLP